MFHRALIILLAVSLPAPGEDLDTPFTSLGELPEAMVDSFVYQLSLKAASMQGYVNPRTYNSVVVTDATVLSLTADSPERTPGSGPTKIVMVKTKVGDGLIDIAATEEGTLDGTPKYPPDKPAATLRSELNRLLLVNDEVRLRLRFRDATHHYLIRYENGTGLRILPLAAAKDHRVVEGVIPEFKLVTASDVKTTWHCNAITTWATEDEKVLWSVDIPIQGQPSRMTIVGDVLFVTTTAGHSFYVLKDTGKIVFYDKAVLLGQDPMKEILDLGRLNMEFDDKRQSLPRYIYAAVTLNDRRSIPFLIDCIKQGRSFTEMAMAIAALEKFNGNPDFWSPKAGEPGAVFYHSVSRDRIWRKEHRDAEIAKWREVFAAELSAEPVARRD